MATLAQAAGEEHREDAVFANGLMQRGDQVLLGNRALGEVLFHQLVLALGHQFDQRFVRGLGVGCDQAGGNLARSCRGHRRSACSRNASIVTRSTTPWNPLRIDDGQLHRNAAAAPALVQIVDQGADSPSPPPALGWSIWLMTTMRGTIGLFGISPDALGHRLHAILGIDDDAGGLNRQQGGAGLVRRTCGSRACRRN